MTADKDALLREQIALLKECRDALQCHARHETKELRERMAKQRIRIAAALEDGGWIRCSERLPDEIGQMCRWRPLSGIEENGFYYSGYFYSPGKRYTKSVVSEWQPIMVSPPTYLPKNGGFSNGI